jgi:sigma-B regulation protein RsbU (phosphoserine phosphatase)
MFKWTRIFRLFDFFLLYSVMITDNNRIKRLESEVESLRSAVEELTVLNDLAMAASSAMEVDRMLDLIVEKSIKAVKAEQGAIQLLTPRKENPLQTLIRQADQRSRLMTYKVGIHLTGWVLKYQLPLLVENLATDERFSPTEQEKQDIHSVLCVPILSRGQIIGILSVTNKKSVEPFSKDDLRLLSIIAAQSGQLIQNLKLQQEVLEKQRLANELAMARKMQYNLIPKSEPQSEFLDISSYFKPAEEVGGDYYDYFSLDDTRIGIVQADESGHGASAAMIMTMIKGILHTITFNFTTADRALEELNQILNRIAPPEIFVTMVFMVFDADKKILTISNAGHNPVLFYEALTKSVIALDVPGCVLNGLKEPEYRVKKINLNPEDSLLVYTDGFTEAANPNNEMFGQSRLLQEFSHCADAMGEGIIQHLTTQLRSHIQNKPPHDDIALIAIKLKK